jgi:hypothetical protein
LIEAWALPVTTAAGCDPVVMERNLVQTREGGYDLLGLDWLALEVKRQENLQVSTWWKQTVKQAKPGQTPFLMYRQNRGRWKFRTALAAAHYSPCGQSTVSQLVVELEEDQAKLWFQTELWNRLSNSVASG